MPQANVLNWMDGAGWLILSGGKDDEVRANALARVQADGGTVYLSLEGERLNEISPTERTMEDLEDLGARTGYIVDVMAEDDQTLHDRIADAGIVVISGGESVEQLRSGLLGAAINGVKAAYEQGAVIYAEGYAAAVFGTWALLASGKTVGGVEWLKNTLVVIGLNSIVQSPPVQGLLKFQPEAIALGIAAGSALALGPEGEVEAWGKKQITIALGSSYHP
ncbi:MAG: hypothetical protein U0694_13660 [Anaerolineae bacterium]